jgi:uncharacterized phage protein (TIGR02218 family)
VTYQGQETSIEAGQPVELYVFTIGTETYRYTSAEDFVTFAANTYVPKQIERSDPVQTDQERKQELKITMPAEDPVCSRFIGVVPGKPLFLDLLRFHRGDTEAYNVWSGKIIGATFKQRGAVCEMSGVTSESALNRNIPRIKYQGVCNHVLYDDNCKVNKDSYKYTDNVSSVSGATVTINGISAAKGAGWAIGGYIDYGSSDYRLVTAQSGDTLTLVLPFADDMVGETVDVYAGCDHLLTTCQSKFSNNLNYGGFAFVPTLNPFNASIV